MLFHLDFDVDSVCLSPFDEGSPQPVVHIGIADVTNHIRPPVDSLINLITIKMITRRRS
jgi:hypothetical protein